MSSAIFVGRRRELRDVDSLPNDFDNKQTLDAFVLELPAVKPRAGTVTFETRDSPNRFFLHPVNLGRTGIESERSHS